MCEIEQWSSMAVETGNESDGVSSVTLPVDPATSPIKDVLRTEAFSFESLCRSG